MKKITKTLLILLSISLLFNCSNDDNPVTTPENHAMRLDSIISTDNSMSFIYKYNDNLNTETEMFGIGEEGDSYKEKMDFFYNSNNLLDNAIYEEWDGTDYVNSGKSEHTYNSNNLVSTEIYKKWNGSDYINNYKIENIYNSNQDIITKIGSDWVSNWNVSSSEHYNYNSGILTELVEDNDGTNHDIKSNYIYENGILKKIEEYRWNDDENDWQILPWRKFEYLYNNDNLTDIIEYYDHFPNDGVWEQGDSRYEFEYDNTYVISDLVLPLKGYNWLISKPFHPNHMITKFKIFEASSENNWTLFNEYEYFYTNVTN